MQQKKLQSAGFKAKAAAFLGQAPKDDPKAKIVALLVPDIDLACKELAGAETYLSSMWVQQKEISFMDAKMEYLQSLAAKLTAYNNLAEQCGKNLPK